MPNIIIPEPNEALNNCLEYANLLFANTFEQSITKFRLDVSNAIEEYSSIASFDSNSFITKRHRLAYEVAKFLSKERFILDCDTFKTFNLSIKEYHYFIIGNQERLLINDYQSKILEIYEEHEYRLHERNSTIRYWNEQVHTISINTLTQAKREILALTLLPDTSDISDTPDKSPIPSTVITNNTGVISLNNNNSQVNITQSINDNTQLINVINEFINQIKSTNIHPNIKEEAVDMAETVVEQAKTGQPKKWILKAFSEKISSFKDTITGCDATLKASVDFYNTVNKISELLKQITG